VVVVAAASAVGAAPRSTLMRGSPAHVEIGLPRAARPGGKAAEGAGLVAPAGVGGVVLGGCGAEDLLAPPVRIQGDRGWPPGKAVGRPAVPLVSPAGDTGVPTRLDVGLCRDVPCTHTATTAVKVSTWGSGRSMCVGSCAWTLARSLLVAKLGGARRKAGRPADAMIRRAWAETCRVPVPTVPEVQPLLEPLGAYHLHRQPAALEPRAGWRQAARKQPSCQQLDHHKRM